MNFSLRTAIPTDAMEVSALVQTVFDEFIAPDWAPTARAAFATESSPERFAQSLADPTFAAVAHAYGRVIGVILLPTPSVLTFLCVDRKAHGQGVATALWEAARSHLESTYPTVKTVERNSSPYAVSAYKALGVYPISEPFLRGGCLATRMACWLPGRALAAADNAA